jgi:hypothetical protein
MKKFLFIILVLLVASCGSYTITSYHDPIKNVLAVTKSGDTVQVSLRELESQKYNNYTRYYLYNDWRLNNWDYPYRYYNFSYGIPYRYKTYIPPKKYTPKPKTKVYSSTPRGRTNNQNRNYSSNSTNRRSSEGRRNNQ